MKLMKEVLIVENDEIIAHLLEGMLLKRDYVITGKVATGEEALIQVAEHNPDLVIMDVTLHGKIDGIFTAYYVNHVFNTPVVFISEKTDEETINRALSSGPFGYITIPFNTTTIVTTSEIAIANHEMMRRLTGFEERFSQNIMSLLDAVIITDAKGRVLLMNPYAERLIEVKMTEAMMVPLNRLLMLVDTRTGEQIDDPVRDIIRESMVIGLENYIAIISLKGKRREVALKAQPITDNRDQVIGVFVRIHEKSQNEKKIKRQT
jgi:two-component system, response regulator PdtaR